MNVERLLLTSPKALAEVLVTKNYDFEKSRLLRLNLGRILGVGILLAEGNEHKRQRRLLTPAFSYRHIKDLYPIFWTKAGECVEKMAETVSSPAKGVEDASVVNAQSWASRVTLDIIGVAGMGHDFGSVGDPNSKLSRTYQDLVVVQPGTGGLTMLIQLLFFLAPRLVANLPIKRNEEIKTASHIIRSTCFELIDEKRKKLEKGDHEKDILSVALESGGFASDDDIVNQLMTFLAAGHETTASAMSWACYHLCRHPEIQKKLREEVQSKLPSPRSGETVSAADFEIEKMPYLHAVCNEVLRLYPSVPMTTRLAAKDTTICNQFVPKETMIVICPWAINTSPELWGADAEEFKPERWLAPGQANSGGATSNYAFLTFLHGPRSCIGQAFAKAEFEVLLASWVGRLEMEFADKDYVLQVGGGITSRPLGGLKIRCKEAEGW
jgi:cytochrome P450